MSSAYSTPEWAAWLASIREMPDDDNRRLFAADFLEERGEGERVEFIRWQCHHPHQSMTCDGDSSVGQPCPCPSDNLDNRERYFCPSCQFARDSMGVPESLIGEGGGWVSERGFISRVSGPLVSLIGGECGRCGGEGSREVVVDVIGGFSRYEREECQHCNGTGSTPGVLAALLKREPVIQAIVTDREPDPIGDNWCWLRIRDGLADTGACLPAEIFDLLEGERERAGEDWAEMIGHHDEWVMYPTPDAARAALSAALLRLVQPVEVPT